ncbi:hypothetical protein Tco_1563134 [Tanacetum coccineum]
MNPLITFIKSHVIWERVHDFQLGIESYQIKVNLTAPTLTFPGIEAHESYSIVDKPSIALIYLNIKDEKRVMYLTKIVKFCDATLEMVLKEIFLYSLKGSDGVQLLQSPLDPVLGYVALAIMPPRRVKKKYVKRLVGKRVAKAIEEYKKTRDNLDNARSSRGNTENAGGTMNVQGCSHKTFMNGKPHSFNGTKGVVGLRRWIEKIEQVFEICKCAEEDKVMFAASTFEGRALHGGTEMCTP